MPVAVDEGMRPISLFCAVLALAAGSGCATHDRIARPPSPGDVARINGAAQGSAKLSIQYVEALAPPAAPRVDSPTSIVAADPEHLVVATSTGRPVSVALSSVDAVAVSGQRRGQGAITGAFAGLGAGLLIDLGLYALISATTEPLSDGGPKNTCSAHCAETFTAVALASALIGAGIGALVGSKTVYHLDAGR
jgi:hypothetical protein